TPVTSVDDLTINMTGAASKLTISSPLVVVDSINSVSKNIFKNGPGTLEVKSVRNEPLGTNASADTLWVNAGRLKITADTGATSRVNALSIASGASMDLSNNSMVIDYPSNLGGLLDDARTWLANGKNNTNSAADGGHPLG